MDLLKFDVPVTFIQVVILNIGLLWWYLYTWEDLLGRKRLEEIFFIFPRWKELEGDFQAVKT